MALAELTANNFFGIVSLIVAALAAFRHHPMVAHTFGVLANVTALNAIDIEYNSQNIIGLVLACIAFGLVYILNVHIRRPQYLWWWVGVYTLCMVAIVVVF